MKYLYWLLLPFFLYMTIEVATVSGADATAAVKTSAMNNASDIPVTNVYRISPRLGAGHLDLSTDWEFGCLPQMPETPAAVSEVKEWHKMSRPMTVQKALFYSGMYPDPYQGMNSKLYDWTLEKTWCFRRSFTLPSNSNSQLGYAFLSFEGLDYYSTVWFNGHKLGCHEGMFGGPEFEVSSFLKKEGRNTIVVAVDSARKRNPKMGKFQVTEAIKPWGTAAGDNALPFFSQGLWRGVRLDLVPKIHLERPYLVTRSADSNKAVLRLETEILADRHSLEFSLYPPKNRQLIDLSRVSGARVQKTGRYAIRVEFRRGGQSFVQEFPFDLYEGRNWFRTDLTIDQPALWYPNRLGEQPIYDVRVDLLQNGVSIDATSFPFGIRTICWTETPGPKLADRWGDWQCSVNGKSFFIKGINWMPIDALFDLPAEKYRWYLKMAKDAGIQMLRIWGPGLQESEEFYDACDEYGLMVWQDFPIGNMDVSPWNTICWESQTMHTIMRLRNRASLAVWCGGNEFNPYCPGNTPYTGIIERNLKIFDPSRKFVRTSPDEGSFHAYPDMDPTWYKKLMKYYPALNESGIHSVTSARSLANGLINPKEFQHVDKMYLEEYRQLCPESIHHFVEYYPSRIPRMLSRASHYVDLKGLTIEDMALGTQLGAGEFYQIFSEGMQGNYPVTAVQMPWVFARTWPVISGVQLVDGTGLPVAPYYFLKRTYEPIHLVFDIDRLLWKAGEAFSSGVKILNLTKSSAGKGTVTLRILDDRFKELHAERVDVTWKNAPSVVAFATSKWTIPADYKDRFFFVIAELKSADELISRSVYMPRTMTKMSDTKFYDAWRQAPQPWPAGENGLCLKKTLGKAPQSEPICEIVSRKTRQDGEYRITEFSVKVVNRSTAPSPVTWFDLKELGPIFYAGDNFFWLAPGEERTIPLTVRENAAGKPGALTVLLRSWNSGK